MSGGKGDSTLKAQEQAQANFTNTLQSTFKQQFGAQSQILNFLSSKLQPLINNPQGFSPQALTTMQTQAGESASSNFTNAQKATQELEAARGGSGLPSGVDAQLTAENANAAAAQNAGAQQNITLANEQQKQTNYWNALGALSGVANAENPLGYASSANSGAGEVADLGNAYKSSQSSQLLGALGGIAAGAGTAAATGLKAAGGCWIAAACFDGWSDPRTMIVRHWLNTEFIKSWYGRLTMRLYLKFGEQVARKPLLVRMLKPLFNKALKKAVNYGR